MALDVAAERERITKEKEKQHAKEKQRQAALELKEMRAQEKANAPKSKYICSQCGNLGRPKLITKGNIIVELVLWMIGLVTALFTFGIFIIVALIYSIWRHLSRFKGCPKCHGGMIETASPVGQKMYDQYHR